jgi:hypothetical protein
LAKLKKKKEKLYQIPVEYLHPMQRKVWKTGSGMTDGWMDRPGVN